MKLVGLFLCLVFKLSSSLKEIDPFDCNSYSILINGTKETLHCESGYHFDPIKLECMEASKAACHPKYTFLSAKRNLRSIKYDLEALLNEYEATNDIDCSQFPDDDTASMTVDIGRNLCDSTRKIFNGKSYITTACIVNERMTYQQAKVRCSMNGMNLYNPAYNDQLTAAVSCDISGKKSKSYWVGGSSCSVLLRHASNAYSFFTDKCDTKHFAVCEYVEDNVSGHYVDTSKCKFKNDLYSCGSYIKSACIINRGLKYDQARQECAKYGMNLFILDDPEVQIAFDEANMAIFKKWRQGSFWINGQHSYQWSVFNSDGSFKAELNENLRGAAFRSTPGQCLKYSTDHGLYAAIGNRCNQGFFFICEYIQ